MARLILSRVNQVPIPVEDLGKALDPRMEDLTLMSRADKLLDKMEMLIPMDNLVQELGLTEALTPDKDQLQVLDLLKAQQAILVDRLVLSKDLKMHLRENLESHLGDAPDLTPLGNQERMVMVMTKLETQTQIDPGSQSRVDPPQVLPLTTVVAPGQSRQEVWASPHQEDLHLDQMVLDPDL